MDPSRVPEIFQKHHFIAFIWIFMIFILRLGKLLWGGGLGDELHDEILAMKGDES